MNYCRVKDGELIKSYLSGNEGAFKLLVNKHQQRIYSYILVRIQNDDIANDIFQDTFVKIVNTLKGGKYNEKGKFLQWSLRIAHNLIIDYYRREKRIPTMSSTDKLNVFKDSSLNIEASIIKDQIESDLYKLIEKLPEKQREVLRLRHFSRLSFKEIADQTQVSINTALGRMRYALINLRKLMGKNGVSLLQ